MKRKSIGLFIIALLLAPNLFALDYGAALKMARKDNKPVMLYFYSKGCSYCRMMDKNTLADKEIEDVLKNNFVYQRIEVEKSPDLAKLYGVEGYPASWFLEPSGKRLFEAPGYIQKPLFRKVLEYVKGGYYRQMSLNDYMEKKK
jgi:thioredoxin-related protein